MDHDHDHDHDHDDDNMVNPFSWFLNWIIGQLN